MPLAAAIPLFALAGASLVCAGYYAVVAYRILRSLKRLPTLASALPLADEVAFWPSLCVVVPAHNEQDVIGALACSLREQDYPSLSVVFALDRCTDDTEAILRAELAGAGAPPSLGRTLAPAEPLDPRFEIITIDNCPDDWAGKVHAAHTGVTRSAAAESADLLLFTDADTWFHPSALRAAVTLLTNRHLDLLSLLPTLTMHHWFERIVQPAAAFELIRRYPLDRLNRHSRLRFANGQFLLFKRDAYEALGGHARVKDALLEDLAFAKLITRQKSRRRLGVLLSGGLFRCRMYADWSEFRRGWKRIYTEASHRRVKRLRRDAWRIRLLGALLPALALLTLAAGFFVWLALEDAPLAIVLVVSGALGLLGFALGAGLAERTQGLPPHLVLTYPIGAWLTGSILREAAADLAAGRKTLWAGRAYAREAR